MSSSQQQQQHPTKEHQHIVFKILNLFVDVKANESTIAYRERLNALLKYFNTLFIKKIGSQSSTPSSQSLLDEFKLYEQVQKKLLTNNAKKEKLTLFGDLYRELTNVNKTNNSILLTMLLDDKLLSGSNNGANGTTTSTLTNQIKQQQTKVNGNSTTIDKQQQQVNTFKTKQEELHHKPLLSKLMNTNTTTETPNNINHLNGIDSDDIIPKQQQKKEYPLNNIKLQPEVQEHLIVADLIFIFQGIEGKYIKFYHDIDAFAVDPNVNLSKQKRDLVGRISEFGWIFKQIRLFLINNPFTKNGLTNQSFCSTIKDELEEFYKLIALLETKTTLVNKDTSSSINQSITLREMFFIIQEPLNRIKFIASLVSGVALMKGGQTISYVECFRNHGNQSFRAMVESILLRVTQPLFAMIQRWIFEGEISDPYEEFFIAKNSSVPLDKTWRDKYNIRSQMVPSILTVSMCKKIMVIGKSINFMKHCCKEPLWSVDRKALGLSSVLLENYTDIPSLAKIVEKTTGHSSKRLLDIMLTRFKFIQHCQALKRYMLLGQGDFIQYLMDTLGEDLLKPASQLSRHRLVGILEGAIRNSNAQYQDEDVIKRLDISLLEDKPGSNATGWDIFALDYHIDMPMNTVIQKQDIIKYKKIFHFLWCVKRVEYSLNSTWRKIRTYNRTLSSLEGFGRDLQRANVQTHEMVHFMNTFQYYVMFEVIECAWEQLCNKVNNQVNDLEELIEAHSSFLHEIGAKTFLMGTHEQQCYDSFKKVLHTISTFTTLQNNLCVLAMAIEKEPVLTNSHNEKIQRELNNYRNNFKNIQLEYQKDFKQFREEASKLKIHQDVNPISLLYMLDFNEFYSPK